MCLLHTFLFVFFFFFQAEDGIRDKLVTGVQTCALPISFSRLRSKLARLVQISVRARFGRPGKCPSRAPALAPFSRYQSICEQRPPPAWPCRQWRSGRRQSPPKAAMDLSSCACPVWSLFARPATSDTRGQIRISPSSALLPCAGGFPAWRNQ